MAAGPWIPPHCHLPSLEWLDMAANESAKEVHAHQPISEQTLEDVTHGLQLAGIFLSHPVPLVGLDGGRLPITTRNGVPASFLKKNHTFHHPTDGLEYGSTLISVQT
jgi:hypothetical protein